MTKYSAIGFCVLCLGMAGCLSPDGKTEMPWDTVARQMEPEREPPKGPIASTKSATRVHAIGAKLVSSNPKEFARQPVFFTAGIQEPMLFSQKDGQIVISEGLVNRCASDDELAALLCVELGKLSAGQRREQTRIEDLPPAPRLTSDVVGSGSAPDMTRMAEEGYMNKRPAATGRRPVDAVRADTATLSRNYLKKAGYDPECAGKIEPWIKEAEENADKRDFMKGR